MSSARDMFIRIRNDEQSDRPQIAVELEGQNSKEFAIPFQQKARLPVNVDKQLILGPKAFGCNPLEKSKDSSVPIVRNTTNRSTLGLFFFFQSNQKIFKC
ncbi:hypothetical protein PAECIP111802_06759 [Paenibacillus allorhizosphaerae]|uniref:Uncharacterized protein n=2 Tax=Paenibacillus allorhizosphaerae TaxID=2849866 RepID=A0ABM8VT94_9BACL|nr:hypothetical protein PAECIP111802_06759 [Paenibacillus allorhizosphaerae]